MTFLSKNGITTSLQKNYLYLFLTVRQELVCFLSDIKTQKKMKTKVELFGTTNVPVIDNGVYAKKFTRRAKTYAQRVENMAKRIDFVAAANHLPADRIIQFSACHEARGIQYGDADSQWEDAMQINVADKDGCRHYKSEKQVGRPTFCCEKRCYYSESGWLHKDADGYYHYEQLLGDDDYLNGRKVQAAYRRWAELTGDVLTGKLQMMQVSLKIDGKSPFTTAAWVQTVTNVNGATLYFVTLIDNGKMLRLTREEVGCEKLDIPEMGYLRTKFNWLQYMGCGIFARFK